jgi:hypothetical protein
MLIVTALVAGVLALYFPLPPPPPPRLYIYVQGTPPPKISYRVKFANGSEGVDGLEVYSDWPPYGDLDMMFGFRHPPGDSLLFYHDRLTALQHEPLYRTRMGKQEYEITAGLPAGEYMVLSKEFAPDEWPVIEERFHQLKALYEKSGIPLPAPSDSDDEVFVCDLPRDFLPIREELERRRRSKNSK